MFIDASALTAILANEFDGPELLARIERSRTRITSAMATWESTLALGRILGVSIKDAEQAVEDLLLAAGIRVVAVEPSVRSIAIDAYDRYGKSRHPAALNFATVLPMPAPVTRAFRSYTRATIFLRRILRRHSTARLVADGAW